MTYQVHNLFPIPLYQSRLSPLDPITYNKLLSFSWEAPDPNFHSSHQETEERHLLDLAQFSGLKKMIQTHVDKFVYEVIGVDKRQAWTITTSWVNKARPGDYHNNHWHSNSMVSGVYYIKTNPKSGAICFNKDRGYNNLWGDTICIDFDIDTDYNTKAAGIHPSTGDLLLFPSILNHSVLLNESTEDRYSLAFNVFPRGIIGQGGNSEIDL
jgi:uncharacterized protein (TIGR02466 family)